MRIWGYIASSSGLVLGVLTFVLSILTIVTVKGSVSNDFRDSVSNFAIVLLIAAVAICILTIVAIFKIYRTNELYLKVGAEAGSGKIQVVSGQPIRQQKAQMTQAIQPVYQQPKPQQSQPAQVTQNANDVELI